MKTFSFLLIFAALLFFVSVPYVAFGQTKVITEGDEWFYYDLETPPEKGWENEVNPNENWKTGISPLGYGDDRIKTNIDFGDDPGKKHITKYFKKAFRVKNPFKFLFYRLNVQRDDGVVIYLNRSEILRNNMPEGEIGHDTRARGLINNFYEEEVLNLLIFPEDLNIGVNIISASVHQARPTSSDCLFNLELIGDNDPEMVPIILKEQTIQNLNLDIKLKEMNHKLELEKKDLQIEFTEQAKNNFKISFFVIGTLLLLCLIGMYYLWRNFMNSEKKFSKDILELKERNQSKDREMMTISLSQLNNQQYLKELKKKLEVNLKDDTVSAKKELKKIIDQIEYNLAHDEEWENLKKHFDAVHEGFFDKLIKLHPSLSEVELRHCIFIKLHMQTKEIANILHIDPRSVQASRYRLKKKMSLDENTDLKEYLLNI